AVHRQAKAIYGGSWDYWWLRTPIDGVVWCNCPHIPDLNGLSVEDQTYVEYEARKRIFKAMEFARQNLPGFERTRLVDTAPQLGPLDVGQLQETLRQQGAYLGEDRDPEGTAAPARTPAGAS